MCAAAEINARRTGCINRERENASRQLNRIFIHAERNPSSVRRCVLCHSVWCMNAENPFTITELFMTAGESKWNAKQPECRRIIIAGLSNAFCAAHFQPGVFTVFYIDMTICLNVFNFWLAIVLWSFHRVKIYSGWHKECSSKGNNI